MTGAARAAPGGLARARRLALPLLLFTGLAWIEVAHALDRVATERAAREEALLERVDRQQEALARTIADLLGDGASHALALGRSPAVRALLADDDDATRTALERTLLPYLSSFRGLDRITLLDTAGRHVFRCERLGDGVAALPRSLLTDERDRVLDALVGGTERGTVTSSPLLHDAERVEVETARRSVFHYVTPVFEGGRRIGTLAVTTYAAPLLDVLAELDGQLATESALLDAGGRRFAAPPGARASAPARGDAVEAALRAPADVGAVARVLADGTTLFVRPTGGTPPLFLATRLGPDVVAAHVAEATDLGPTLLRSLAVLAAITLASWVLARALARNERLRETEGFLERIRQESAKHRALMEAAADLILVVSAEDEVPRDWNQRAASTLDLEGQPRALARHFAPASLERLRAGLRTAREAPGEPVVVTGLTLACAQPGRTLDVDARCVGLSAGGEHTVELALNDRTREREMERRVQTAERLSSLGLLTAGVAHEINNPLEGIANYLRLLERTQDEDKRRRHLSAVRHGYERIRDIVGDLLSFARPGRESGTVDLARVTERAVALARLARAAREVALEVHAPNERLCVEGSEGRLEQVLLNLLLNAEEAARGLVRVDLRARGQTAEVVVTDDGPGIAEDDLPRVFDPFFTRGEGTGLGLAVSYGIIQAHGGELVAENGPAGGARFTVRLPLGTAPPPTKP